MKAKKTGMKRGPAAERAEEAKEKKGWWDKNEKFEKEPPHKMSRKKK